MQPIKTTNAMNPAPAKGIQSLPTPVIDDVIITETVNAWKGDYQKLEYGTMWDSVPHGSQQGSFPEHKLVFQQVSSEDGQWVKRIWVNDRVNQDSYNYAIKYSAGSQEHPIYTRTYIVPRETYAPLLDGTPDPLFPNALLVDEEATRTENELDSKYITVTRVYETIPGPAVPTRRYNERGDLETVIVQTVPPNTPPDPDGLLVTGSRVEQVETGKGVKTTATVKDHSLLQIKEKKEGLLGETITTDDIVSPTTEPDALSESVVASVVQQTSATKAVKRTTTSIGPQSLSKQSKDGKLLGDVISTQSIVAPNSTPDVPSATILSSEVNQIDSGKAVKTNIILNSTPILSGKQNEQGLLGTKETTESIVSAGSSADALSLSVISSNVEPIDSVRSRKVTVTSTEPISLSGGQKKEGLLGETNVNESIVAAGSPPDSLSQTVISSVIDPIDAAKSKKTTITSTGPISLSGSEKKGGLLGEVNIVESIVPTGTSPDNLSQTIVSSSITPIDSAKSKKTTVTASGPINLTQKSKDGKLLGDITSTESVVAPSTDPDAVSSTILSSEVRQVDSGKAIKTNLVLNSTPILLGRQNEEGLLGVKSTVESIVATGSPADPLSLSVISSQVEPIDSVRSKKTTVTSNGPISLTQKSKDGKLLGDITSTQSVVPPSTEPYAISSTILSSEVKQVDSGKAIITNLVLNSTPTLSGNQNEQGLLGEKSTTESIVATDSPADPLSLSVISSQVEPIDSVRSKKTTVTSNGPNTLSGEENKDGLMGKTTKTETIVPAGYAPDPITFNTISSEVTPIDSSKSKKTTINHNGPVKLEQFTLTDSPAGLIEAFGIREIIDPSSTNPNTQSGGSLYTLKASSEAIDETKIKTESLRVTDWPVLSGVEYDEILGIPIEYTEKVVSSNEILNPASWQDIANKSYKPLDKWKTMKRTYDRVKIATALLSQYYVTQTQVQINLPNKLLEVTAYFSRDYSKGENKTLQENAGGDAYGFTMGGGFKSSGSISADVYFKLENGFNGYIDGEEHTFFMDIDDNGRVSKSIIAELNDRNNGSKTYLAWPNIKRITENILLFTGGKSKTESASKSEDVSINGFAEAERKDWSYDIDTNVNTVTLPDAIHEQLTVNEIYSGPEIPTDLQITGGVNPKILAATSPAKFPTGNYLISSSMDLFKYGLVKVKAITVTITDAYV